MKYVALVLTFVLCFCLSIRSAQAGEREEAEEHFRAGVSLQKVEDFEAAIVEFEASLRLFPTKSALFNLANCLKATHRYAEALAALERLQSEYGSELEDPMRSAVQSQIGELKSLTAWLRIEVDQPGAEVRVDGKLIGQSPLRDPVRLSLGDHELNVSLHGFQTELLRVRLASKDEAVQRIVLRKTTAPSATESASASAGERAGRPEKPQGAAATEGSSNLRTFGWISAGSGAALIVAGAITGGWALSVDNDLSSVCQDTHCPPSRGSDVDKLNTLTTATNVLLGAGVTLGASGIVMLVLAAPKAEKPVQHARTQTHWQLSFGSRTVSAAVAHEF